MLSIGEVAVVLDRDANRPARAVLESLEADLARQGASMRRRPRRWVGRAAVLAGVTAP